MSTCDDLPEHLKTDQPCSFCGEKERAGIWFGHAEVHSCSACAITVLPRLIADATFKGYSGHADSETTLLSVEMEFWRAVAICKDRYADKHQK